MREKLKPGDLILLILDWRRRYLIQLKKGEEFHTHRGVIRHDDIIGGEYGMIIKSSMGVNFYVAKPTLSDMILKFTRKTQIIYPKDAAYIITLSGIGPGSIVIEAGTGMGALTCMLANVVRPHGKVYSYEIRSEFLEYAKHNIERAGLSKWVVLKNKDITKGIDEKDIDAVILDMPSPWLVVPHAKNSLKGSGVFISFIPTLNQAEKTVIALEKAGFFDIKISELIEREYQTEPGKIRPRTITVGHTGYILAARKAL